MEQCIVAVFEDRASAQQSMDELVASGFAPDDVRLREGNRAGADTAPASADSARDEQSVGASIKNLFSDIFGSANSEHAQLYSDAVAQGNFVLTVVAADDEELDRATIIVERFKPVDIDQQASAWRAGMAGQDAMRMGSGGGQQAQSISQQQGVQGSLQGSSLEGSSVQGSPMQGGSMSGSQQYAQTGGSSAPAQRSGVRVFPRDEPSGTQAGTRDMNEDTYSRRHWDINYASHGNNYDEYAPAYRYGSSMANSDQYKGRSWADVEPSLKTDWESKNPGSAWEKFKAAIRHGWERITS